MIEAAFIGLKNCSNMNNKGKKGCLEGRRCQTKVKKGAGRTGLVGQWWIGLDWVEGAWQAIQVEMCTGNVGQQLEREVRSGDPNLRGDGAKVIREPWGLRCPAKETISREKVENLGGRRSSGWEGQENEETLKGRRPQGYYWLQYWGLVSIYHFKSFEEKQDW